MEESGLSRDFSITQPAQGAVFLDPKRRRILAHFMGAERSMSEVARRLDIPLNRLAHHVAAFLRLGLIREARAEKRAGRPIRYYRAIADSFRVDAAAMKQSSGGPLAAELRAALDHAALVSGKGDLLLSLDAEGRPLLRRAIGRAQSDAAEYWRMLSLTPVEARQLGRELAELMKSYDKPPQRGAKIYLVHAALAPRRQD